jgi:hypothetical protein
MFTVLPNQDPTRRSHHVQRRGSQAHSTPREISPSLDEVISIDEIGTYKPDPRAYRHAVERLPLDRALESELVVEDQLLLGFGQLTPSQSRQNLVSKVRRYRHLQHVFRRREHELDGS